MTNRSCMIAHYHKLVHVTVEAKPESPYPILQPPDGFPIAHGGWHVTAYTQDSSRLSEECSCQAGSEIGPPEIDSFASDSG